MQQIDEALDKDRYVYPDLSELFLSVVRLPALCSIHPIHGQFLNLIFKCISCFSALSNSVELVMFELSGFFSHLSPDK